MHVTEHHTDLFSCQKINRPRAILLRMVRDQAQVVKKGKGKTFHIIGDNAHVQTIKTMFLLCLAPDSVATCPEMSLISMSSSITGFLHDC